MSINSISAASSYYSFSSINNDEEELIKKKLLALGIVPTGNAAADKILLQKAEKEAKTKNVETSAVGNSNSAQPQSGAISNAIPTEWINLMAQVGVTATKDIDADYQKATAIIKSKLTNCTDEVQKKKYRSLQEQIDKFVANNQSSLASAATAMVGATMLSQMNKISLLNN